jgi:hypothetical protein
MTRESSCELCIEANILLEYAYGVLSILNLTPAFQKLHNLQTP